eukprot:CAMPEP_0113949666 /NCGR_PEP_ID=MMETSP1339-20121228/76833_1 /TAXON_ID=94617 /ORGANISM="Fibrocapsa japonica" /LENGTH=109 /DNA_ID=CAMNT_0000957195 /DNA_START=1 /DNA_END=330 /DNA_ORIENTATION=+ /assembly_acc=CAM_ASM_000762
MLDLLDVSGSDDQCAFNYALYHYGLQRPSNLTYLESNDIDIVSVPMLGLKVAYLPHITIARKCHLVDINSPEIAVFHCHAIKTAEAKEEILNKVLAAHERHKHELTTDN